MPLSAPALFAAKAFIAAQMSVCPPAEKVPAVEVLFVPKKPVYITDVPVSRLTKYMQGNKDATHAASPADGWRVFGATEGLTQGTNYEAAYSFTYDLKGNICYNIDRFHFVIRYTPRIFIAAELKGLECNYKVTKLHEERHVAADLKVLRAYMPKIKMEILWFLRSFGPQGPYPVTTAGEAAEEIQKKVIDGIRPLLNKLYEERRRRSNEIDTVENYKYESGLCPGEWPKVKE